MRRFLAVDLAWIAGCAEGVVVLPGWEASQGAKAEVALAHAIELPVWELRNAPGILSAEDTRDSPARTVLGPV